MCTREWSLEDAWDRCGLQGKDTESPCSLKDTTGIHSAQRAMDSVQLQHEYVWVHIQVYMCVCALMETGME